MMRPRLPSACRSIFGVAWLGFVIFSLAGVFVGTGASGDPTPLAKPTVITSLLLVLQAIIVALMLILPGLEMLRRLNAGRLPNWPVAVVAGVAAVFSCGLVTMSVVLFAYVLGSDRARLVFIVAMLAAPVLSRNALWQFLVRLSDGMSRSRAFVLGAGVVLYIALAAAMAGTPYPQIRTYGAFTVETDLGDAPAYCRVASNIASANQLAEDYFVGDCENGVYHYIPRMTLVPVAVTAACYWLLGVNAHSMFVIHMFLGMVMLAAGVAVVFNGRNAGRFGRITVFTLLLACPAVCFHVALGSHGVLPAMVVTVLLALAQIPRDTLGPRGISLALVVALLPIIHPIGVLLLGAILLPWIAARALRSQRPVVWTTVIAVALTMCVITFCVTLRHWAKSINANSAVLLTRFDTTLGAFRPTIEPYSIRCENWSAVQFSGAPQESHSNLDLGEEILAHPLPYAAHIAKNTWDSLAATGRDFIPHDPLGTAAAVLLILLAGIRRDQRLYVAAALLFSAAMGWMNPFGGTRHRLCVLVPLLMLSIRTLVMWASSIKVMERYHRLAVVLLLVPGILLSLRWTKETYRVRRFWKNREYVIPVETVLQMTNRPHCVATQSPQLLGCLTGARCVGGTWFADHLDGVVERFQPEYILVGRHAFQTVDAREDPPSGYTFAVHDALRRYMILRRLRPSNETPRHAGLDSCDPGITNGPS